MAVTKDKTFKQFILEVFSDKGYGSSKRIIGTLMALAAMISTLVIVCKEGGTNVVENLVQTEFIVGTSLLGITSITNIWKGAKTINVDNEKSEVKEEKK